MHPKHSAVRVIMILRETIILNNKSARQMLTEHKRLRYCSRTKSFFKVLMFCMTCAWLSGPRSYMHKRICLDACFKQLKLRCSRDISPICFIKTTTWTGSWIVNLPRSCTNKHARCERVGTSTNWTELATQTDRQTGLDRRVKSSFVFCNMPCPKSLSPNMQRYEDNDILFYSV